MTEHLSGVASCPWTGVVELPNSNTNNKARDCKYTRRVVIPQVLSDNCPMA